MTGEPETARLQDITHRLVEDARPIVDRVRAVPDRARPLVDVVRPKFDVFLPLVDEMRPLMDDLRPVMSDLGALAGALWLLVYGVALRIWRRVDIRALSSAASLAGTAARRAGAARPGVRMPTLSVSAPRMPRAPSVRLPSVLPRLGSALSSVARRIRPGRWVLRLAVVGALVFAGVNPTTRDAILMQADSARSTVETMQVPAVELPALELPTVEIPAIELPKIEMPAVELPTIDLPTIDLSKIDLSALQFALPSAAPAKLEPATFEVPPLDAYRAAFESQAPYPTASPNGTVEWVVALRNTGSAGWYRGVEGAQASLALTDGTQVAVQSTPYVAPGQVGWFVVRFRASAGTGTQTVPLVPRIDGRGQLPDLGLFTLVTVR
ncbi:MAG TPA: hypothetical protein VJP45_15190 [Candidatus Limnocylindria bacterium]|nr:hypothetical protein [Candidatus Limnocylindria bacterium]